MAISKELNRGRHSSFCMACPLGLHHQVSIPGLGQRRGRPPAAAVRKVCTDFESPLTEMHGQDNQVLLLVRYPPKVAISKLVNSLEGRFQSHAPAGAT